MVRSIPYESGKVSSKHLFWVLHAGIIGAIIAPLTALGRILLIFNLHYIYIYIKSLFKTYLGGPALLRAAWLTAGAAGGLNIF